VTAGYKAKRAGISRNTLSKLENGYIANIPIVTFEKVLNILGYQIDIKQNNPFVNILREKPNELYSL